MPYLQLNTQPLIFDQKTRRYLYDGKVIPRVTEVLKVVNKDFRLPWALKEMGKYIEAEWKHDRVYTEKQKKEIVSMGKTIFDQISFKAMGKGTSVHDWIEQYVGKNNPKIPPGLEDPINAFQKWESKTDIQWLASEFTIASPKHWFAGTIDFIAIISGELVLGDFKVTSRISDEYFLQTAAYLIALEELLSESLHRPLDQYIPSPMRYMAPEAVQGLHVLQQCADLGIPPTIAYRLILRIPPDGGSVQALKVPTDFKKDRKAFLSMCEMNSWQQHVKDKNKAEE